MLKHWRAVVLATMLVACGGQTIDSDFAPAAPDAAPSDPYPEAARLARALCSCNGGAPTCFAYTYRTVHLVRPECLAALATGYEHDCSGSFMPVDPRLCEP